MALRRQATGLLALAGLALSQGIVDNLSFGQRGVISPDGRSIPNWQLSSSNHEIQLLSDRAILTPPVPGNARGAMWTENTITSEAWTAEFEFRASGQETGSGSLQFWYTKDKDSVGTNSLYTAEIFDGLALLIDQYGGRGGSIRGFLNDGTQDFRGFASLDSLAFGHCDYSYRNLGRPTRVRVSTANGFSVAVDDAVCFTTDRLNLPPGYHFGVTAATGENPDSFELLKFTVAENVNRGGLGAVPPSSSSSSQQPPPAAHPLQRLDQLPAAPEIMPDRDAEELSTADAQFADLHNRLQGLTHLLANVFVEFNALSGQLDAKNAELADRVTAIVEGAVGRIAESRRDETGSSPAAAAGGAGGVPPETLATINRLAQRMENMERVLGVIQREVEGKDYREHLVQLERAVTSVTGGLGEHLTERVGHLITRSAPRLGLFVFIILAVQVSLAGAYILYKRRRAGMPKKYL